jgi:hypothetical protein
VIGIIFYVFCLFPYIKTSPLASDVQPGAFAIGFLIVLGLITRVKLPREVWWLAGVTLFALMVAASSLEEAAFRGCFKYISLFVTTAATAMLIKRNNNVPDWLLDSAVYLYFAVAVLQLLIGYDTFSFLVYEVRTTFLLGRGVTSLTPEPNYYGTIMFFLTIIYYLRGRHFSFPSLLAMFQIVMLSRATLATAILAITIIVYVLSEKERLTLKLLYVLAVMASVPLLASLEYIAESRMADLVELFFQSPVDLILRDASANARAGDIFLSIVGALENGLLPRGFLAWATEYPVAVSEWGDYFLFSGAEGRNDIGSGYGAALYELGAVGLIVPLVLHIGIMRLNDRRRERIAAVAIHLTMLMALSLATPLIGLLTGMLLADERIRTVGGSARPVRSSGPGDRATARRRQVAGGAGINRPEGALPEPGHRLLGQGWQSVTAHFTRNPAFSSESGCVAHG